MYSTKQNSGFNYSISLFAFNYIHTVYFIIINILLNILLCISNYELQYQIYVSNLGSNLINSHCECGVYRLLAINLYLYFLNFYLIRQYFFSQIIKYGHGLSKIDDTNKKVLN